MEDIPAFFKTLCTKKQISNVLPEELLRIFPPNSDGSTDIPLENYFCLCLGYKKKMKVCNKFKIIKCADTPLQGAHLIQIGEDKIIQVESLTRFRKDVLGYEDFVSFERSCFLLLEENEKVIRLHFLRDRITLPKINAPSTSLVKKTPSTSPKPLSAPLPTHPEDDDEKINRLCGLFFDIWGQLVGCENGLYRFKNIIECVFEYALHLLFNEKTDEVYKQFISSCEEWQGGSTS